MKNTDKIRKNTEFKCIYSLGTSKANKYLVMYIVKNGKDINRIGISVSKKVGNSVVRHRITRLIRESYRLNEDIFVLGYDIVIVARSTSCNCMYKEIESALLHVAGILKVKK